MTEKDDPSKLETSSTSPRKWMALAVICSAQFIYLMDVFLVNVSAPQIRVEFKNPAVLKSVFAANQVAFASFVFLGGRLGDLFGRRRIFILGLIGAGSAALLATFADTAAALISARTLQGIFGAFFIPQIMAILVTLFEKEERALAIGVFGMVTGFGGVAGFLSGGLIVEYAPSDLGWRAVFLFIGPSLIALSALSYFLVPVASRPTTPHLKLASSFALFVTAAMIVGPVAAFGAAPIGILLTVLAFGLILAVLFSLFQLRELRSHGRALISSALASSAIFRSGLIAAFLFFMANTSFYLTTTLYLSERFGSSPLHLGLSYVPMGLAFIVGARIGARRLHLIGTKAVRQGLKLQVFSLVLLALVLGFYGSWPIVLVILMIPFGFAQGHTMAPLIGLIVSSASPEETGTASGAQQSSQQFGNALGLSVLGSIYIAVSTSSGAQLSIIVSLLVLAVLTVSALLCVPRDRPE